MKITKNRLKQLIKEEMSVFDKEELMGRDLNGDGRIGVSPYVDPEEEPYDDPEVMYKDEADREAEEMAQSMHDKHDVLPYHALMNSALKGSEYALMKLSIAARRDPDAQAMLDLYYEKRPSEAPTPASKQLSPAERQAVARDASIKEGKLRITKNQLKQIIKEEMGRALLAEADPQIYCCFQDKEGEKHRFKAVDTGSKMLLVSCGKSSCQMLARLPKEEFTEKLKAGEFKAI